MIAAAAIPKFEKFQFHKVQLKEEQSHKSRIKSEFQFHKVQLKAFNATTSL